MPRLPTPRGGEVLKIKDRPLEFSFWPVERTTRRYGLGSRVFATDPWTVIRRSAEMRCTATTLASALSLLRQAEDYYCAAASGVKAAKPLLLYYCYMNLAKAFVLACHQRDIVDNAQHGLSEKLDPPPNNIELVNAFLLAFETPTPSPRPADPVQVFDELLHSLSALGIPANRHRYSLPTLLPQIVPGHRLWVEGTGRDEKERFIAVEEVQLMHDVGSKIIWVDLKVFRDDVLRIGLNHGELLTNSRINGLFREVRSAQEQDGRPLLHFEQITPIQYDHRPSDKVEELVAPLRPLLWRTILSQRPYRQYYLYPSPVAEHPQVLPQILSIYAITYYLGSIVRYRPHHFDEILKKDYGPFIEAFLNDQPTQFLYLMASEFAQREVTKAAIV